MTFDEMGEMLDDIAMEIPEAFYEKLNGGIVLLPEMKVHPSAKGEDLLIMGEYRRDALMGRYIAIYYGSFARAHGMAAPEQMRERLRKTLLHEFTHHMESLAGERGLEKKDEAFMERYHEREKRGT